jgi:hypothetical protein
MNPIDRVLFVGGTFSISLYTKVHKIPNYVVIKNGFNLLGYHNSKPVFIMEDAPDIYGSELRSIVRAAQENNYLMVQLSYKDPFPTDDDIEAMRSNMTQEKET